MNICLQNIVRRNIESCKKKRWDDGISPAWTLQLMNDIIRRVITEDKKDLPELQDQLKEFLCHNSDPLDNYGSIKTGDKK